MWCFCGLSTTFFYILLNLWLFAFAILLSVANLTSFHAWWGLNIHSLYNIWTLFKKTSEIISKGIKKCHLLKNTININVYLKIRDVYKISFLKNKREVRTSLVQNYWCNLGFSPKFNWKRNISLIKQFK